MTLRHFHLFRAALLLPALLTPALSQDTTPAAEGKPPKDDSLIREEGSYGIGTQFATQFRKGEIDTDAFSAGFRDTLEGNQLKYSQVEIQDALKSLQNLIRKEREAADQKEAEESLAKAKPFLEENAKKPGVKTTESGLQYEILTEGTGAIPKATDKVRVHYHGTLMDGSVFDSSVDRGQPSEFGVSGVIKGWTEALEMMPVGSKWRLTVPPQLAYGDRRKSSKIGPNAVLIFEVELLDIVKVQAVTKPVPIPPRAPK